MKLIIIYDFRSRQGLCVSGHKKRALLSVGAQRRSVAAAAIAGAFLSLGSFQSFVVFCSTYRLVHLLLFL
jgi:hypothetical protein